MEKPVVNLDCSKARERIACCLYLDDEAVSCDPVRIRDRLVTLRFPVSAKSLHMGASGVLHFMREDESTITKVEVVVSLRTKTEDIGGYREYGVVASKAHWETKSLPAIQRLFNRRQSYRVPITAGDGVRIKIVGPELFRATLVDLSDTGARLSVEEEVEATLAAEHEIDLELTLPSGAIVVRAEILRRLLRSSSVEYGVRFIDGTRTSEFLDKQRLIADFVLNKQRKARDIEPQAA